MLVRVRRSTLYSCLGMLPQRYVFLPTAAILRISHMIGLGGTDAKPAQVCVGATVLKGLAVRGKTAQNSREEAWKAVTSWLASLAL